MSIDGYVYVPFEQLPAEADPTTGSDFSFGTDVFGRTDGWIVVDNRSMPTRVYKVPAPVSKMLHSLFKERYKMGEEHARGEVRRALGIER